MTLSVPARLAAIAFVSLALSACATMNVKSFVERGANLTRYHTYAWGPADLQTTGDPRLDNNPFFHDRIQTAIEKHLGTRGFEKTSSANIDLLVHYHASVTQTVDANGSDRPYVICDECVPYVYDAGTIVVDLVDARTHQLVWRGWAEGSIDGVVENQPWMEARIDESVARILERLPPRL